MLQDKTDLMIIIFVIGLFSLILAGFNDTDNIVDGLTGDFIEAHQPEEPYIEEVYWEFGDNQRAYGSVVQQNLSEGKHNITLVIEKSDGETERYRGEAEIE